MSAVFQKVDLRWNGEVYSVVPDMALVNDIEQKISLSRLMHRMGDGDPPLSHLATVVSMMLRAGGCPRHECTAEQVFGSLMQAGPDVASELVYLIAEAFFPTVDGMPEGNGFGAVESRPNSGGKNSTKSRSGRGASSPASSGG